MQTKKQSNSGTLQSIQHICKKKKKNPLTLPKLICVKYVNQNLKQTLRRFQI